ncbi:MAG: EAL domain-containing protein [Pseudolabrys sp.]
MNLCLAVNVPVQALVKLPVSDLVKAHRSSAGKWPGLIIDVAEAQILNDLALADELAKKFVPSNVRLAVGDFGSGYAALAKVKELPFVEVKIDRAFVTGCGTDKVKAPICKTAIDLAHNFGSVVVAVGIEKAADAMALVSMGCDFGQGFLARPADAGGAVCLAVAPARRNESAGKGQELACLISGSRRRGA